MVWAFGDGDYGKLGLGNSTAKSSPQVNDQVKTGESSLHRFTGSITKIIFYSRRKSTFSVASVSRKWRVEHSSLWPWPKTAKFTLLDKVSWWLTVRPGWNQRTEVWLVYGTGTKWVIFSLCHMTCRPPHWSPRGPSQEPQPTPAGVGSVGRPHPGHRCGGGAHSGDVIHRRRLHLGQQLRGTGD